MQKLTNLFRRLDFVTFVRYICFEIMRKLFLPKARISFAQGGEDINVLYMLDDKRDGFYLDIGSNDPIESSNTFKLYLVGWHGILVDGNPMLIDKAKKIRKMDTCVHALVSEEKTKMDFYISDAHLYSSIDASHASLGTDDRKVQKVQLDTQTLDEIIEKNLPVGQIIDLLSIDVEGHDFSVLKSISLQKYRPRVIVIEDLHHSHATLDQNHYVLYFKTFRYGLISTDKQNLYFMREEDYA